MIYKKEFFLQFISLFQFFFNILFAFFAYNLYKENQFLTAQLNSLNEKIITQINPSSSVSSANNTEVTSDVLLIVENMG